MIIDLKEIHAAEAQHYLQAAIAPRPIGLVSSLDKDGYVNLAPFSFFNLFSTNPPIVIFSPCRRVRDNTTKHTLENMYEVPEVVIHICDYDMVQQVSLASCDYPGDVNEFIKAGFTEEPATLVRPPMVKESKIKMECRVEEIKPLGKLGGAGNLIICEILRLHIDVSLLDENKKIDQRKINHVARLGGNWYTKMSAENLFELEKPHTNTGIGFDGLPKAIVDSSILSKNNLAQLAGVHEIPVYREDKGLLDGAMRPYLHYHLKLLLDRGQVQEAWQFILAEKKHHDTDKQPV